MKFFHLSVRLINEKPDAFVCPFDKPIKSLYFHSFVVSVLFARFHFKVIRKSLYQFGCADTYSDCYFKDIYLVDTRIHSDIKWTRGYADT